MRKYTFFLAALMAALMIPAVHAEEAVLPVINPYAWHDEEPEILVVESTSPETLPAETLPAETVSILPAEVPVEISAAEAPKLLSVTGTSTGVLVRWQALAGAAGYRVYARAEDSAWAPVGDCTGTSFTVTGLEPGRNYFFTVAALEEGGTAAPIPDVSRRYVYMQPQTAEVHWEDGALNACGEIVPESGFLVSDPIYIPRGFQLVFNSAVPAGQPYYCEYTSYDSFLAAGPRSSGELCCGIQVDAVHNRYVRICIDTQKIDLLDCDPHLRPLPSVPVGIEELSAVQGGSSLTFESGFVSTKTNALKADSDFCTSSLIFLQAGQTVSLKCAAPSTTWLLSEWTQDGQFVQGLISGDNIYHRLTYTAEHDLWLRFSSCVWGRMVPYVREEELPEVTFSYQELCFAEQPLRGKHIVAIGDSLFHGNLLGNEATWLKVLANETGAHVYNYGIPGNTLAACSVDPAPMSARYAEIPQLSYANIILILGGANDSTLSIPLGTLDDMSNSTFMGACNALISGIRQHNYAAKILFFTTYPRYSKPNRLGLTDNDYAEAMQAVCRKNGIPCFNNFTDCGLSFLDKDSLSWIDEGVYLGIGANQHFTPAAYEELYALYRPWIESFL